MPDLPQQVEAGLAVLPPRDGLVGACYARPMHVVFAVPQPADTEGDPAYVQRMAACLRTLGHTVDVTEGSEPIFPPDTLPVVDGSLLSRLDGPSALGAVALIHHLPATREIPATRKAIATSRLTAERLEQAFGVKAAVVQPGADDLPRSEATDGPVRILSVGALTSRNGHGILLRALASLPDLDWSLAIAGSAMPDPVHAGQLFASVAELGLSSRVQLATDLDLAALDQLWRSAGLFVLASREAGCPTALTEALRRGLPVVLMAEGDVGQALPADAGAVCALDDVATLAKCLRRILFDRALRTDMAEGAWRAGQALPDWQTQARLFVDALKR